jgi:hypothetical protein
MSRLTPIIVGAFVLSAAMCVLAADAKDEKAAKVPKIAKLVHLATGKVLAVENDSEDAESHLMILKDREQKDDAAAKDGPTTGVAKAEAKKPSAAALKAQQWKLEKDDAGYKLINRKSDMAVDVPAYSEDEDAQIIIYGLKEGPDDIDNQRWMIVDATAPKSDAKADEKAASATDAAAKPHRIRSKSSGMVLDVDSAGYVVQKRADDKSKSQLWLIVEVKE